MPKRLLISLLGGLGIALAVPSVAYAEQAPPPPDPFAQIAQQLDQAAQDFHATVADVQGQIDQSVQTATREWSNFTETVAQPPAPDQPPINWQQQWEESSNAVIEEATDVVESVNTGVATLHNDTVELAETAQAITDNATEPAPAVSPAPAQPEEPAYTQPTWSVPVLDTLPLPEVAEDRLAEYVPKNVQPDLRACDADQSNLEAAATCELGTYAAIHQGPLPTLQIYPDKGVGFVNIWRVLLKDPLRQPCIVGPGGRQIFTCDGTTVLNDTQMQPYTIGPDGKIVTPNYVIAHELGHVLGETDASVADINSPETQGNPAAVFTTEQYADYNMGVSYRYKLDEGQVTQEDVDLIAATIRKNLGSTKDSTHGTADEREAAFWAGFYGNSNYLVNIEPSSIGIGTPHEHEQGE